MMRVQLAIVALLIAATSNVWLIDAQLCQGDATYYGAGGDGTGTCSFWAAGANNFASVTGNKGLNKGRYANTVVTVALNAPQWNGGFNCGMCIRFRGLDQGAGNPGDKPPANEWTYAIINNQCPECKPCDLDISLSGDGRWRMEWEPVDCPVGNEPLYYSHAGSHANYLKMAVFNHKNPVKSLEISMDDGASWQSGSKTYDNYFIFPSGPFKSPMKVKVTSNKGDVVIDTIHPALNGGMWTGTGDNKGQFGGGGGAAKADPAPAAKPDPPPAAKSDPAPPKQNARAAYPSQPKKSKKCKFQLQKGWQCGGKGGSCTSGTGCVDKPWKGACCQKSKCKRRSASKWVCK